LVLALEEVEELRGLPLRTVAEAVVEAVEL
jgi:hypothetical protein